jgi:hypothetical protein
MKQVSGDVSSASNPSPPVNESGKSDIQPSDLHQTEKTVDGDNNKSSEALVSPPQCLGIKVINFFIFFFDGVVLFYSI